MLNEEETAALNSIVLPSFEQSKPTEGIYGKVILYKPLVVDHERFMDAYNTDISEYVERHNQREQAMKGGKQIMYLSYSHAYRLFRSKFPELEVDCVINPMTGGFVFADIDSRTWYINSYVHDGYRRSQLYYFPILNTLNGMGIFPDDVRKTKEGKPIEGKYIIDGQLINKSIQRAIVKAIALTTGLGLKLWTGDDLSEELVDEKTQLIAKLYQLADAYKNQTGNDYTGVNNLSYISTTGEIERVKVELTDLLKAAKANKASTTPVINEEVENSEKETSKRKVNKES